MAGEVAISTRRLSSVCRSIVSSWQLQVHEASTLIRLLLHGLLLLLLQLPQCVALHALRYDESDDSVFYDTPRFVYHIDEAAVKSLTE